MIEHHQNGQALIASLSLSLSSVCVPLPLSFSCRGGRHPERDEGEERRDVGHHHHQVFPRPQHSRPEGGQRLHSAPPGRRVHLGPAQAHQQPLLTSSFRLPGEVSGNQSFPCRNLSACFGKISDSPNCSGFNPRVTRRPSEQFILT